MLSIPILKEVSILICILILFLSLSPLSPPTKRSKSNGKISVKYFSFLQLLWILLEEDECNLAEHVDVPKVLGDIFESFIGAIYVDSGKDLLKVWEIVYTLMHKEFGNFYLYTG